jgi:hypothetical protein
MAVVWETFEVAARTQTALQGLQDLPLVLVPDQTPGDTEEDQRQKGVVAGEAVLAAWRDRLAERSQPARGS